MNGGWGWARSEVDADLPGVTWGGDWTTRPIAPVRVGRGAGPGGWGCLGVQQGGGSQPGWGRIGVELILHRCLSHGPDISQVLIPIVKNSLIFPARASSLLWLVVFRVVGFLMVTVMFFQFIVELVHEGFTFHPLLSHPEDKVQLGELLVEGTGNLELSSSSQVFTSVQPPFFAKVSWMLDGGLCQGPKTHLVYSLIWDVAALQGVDPS